MVGGWFQTRSRECRPLALHHQDEPRREPAELRQQRTSCIYQPTGGQGVIFAILAPISVSLCKLSGTEEYLIEAK